MSDAQTIDRRPISGGQARDVSRQHIRRRYAADRRLQAYGIIAIALAIGLLGVLLISIVANGLPAFVQQGRYFFLHRSRQGGPRKLADGNFRALVREALKPLLLADATDKRRPTPRRFSPPTRPISCATISSSTRT